MTTPNDSQQADALYTSLHQKTQLEDQNLLEETILGKDLQSFASTVHPSARFQASLENELGHLARAGAAKSNKGTPSRSPGNRSKRSVGGKSNLVFPTLAWGAVILLVVAGLVWAMRSLLPNGAVGISEIEPGQSNEAIVVPATSTLEPVVEETTQPEEQAPQPTPTQPQMYSFPILPNTQVFISVPLPVSPNEVMLFEQLAEEVLSPDNALEMAQKLGVDGTVYQYGSEGNYTNYLVSDGHQFIFFNGSPTRFGYFDGQPVAHEPQGTSLTPEQQVSIAQSFLQQAGLLDFPFRAKYIETYLNEVVFTSLINDIPVITENGQFDGTEAPRIIARVNPQGKVSNITSEKVVYKPVVNLPVITSQEALDKLVNETAPTGVIEAQKTPYTFPDMEYWTRTYEAGEQVFLYGYVSVYQPVSPFGTNLLTLGNIKLELPVSDLEHAALERPGKFFQIWGEMSDPVTLQVVGWQESPIPEEHLIGLIKLEDGRFYLYSGADRLLLVEAPDDIPLDTEVRIRGIRLNTPEPALEWSYIEAGVQPTGGGGGGGGATVFREITLTGTTESAQETVTPTSTPEVIYQPGMFIDGVEGTFYLALERYANGSESQRMVFYPTQQESLPEVYEVRVNGGELDGIDQFHTLPIRLWGTVIEFKENILTLDVSRYEALYPGLDVQAWLGTWELVELGGKNVIRFQDQQGQQYILASSLLYEQTEFAGYPGDLVILEGLQIPGNMYEGLPVIEERSGMMAEIGQTSLEGYQLVSKEINVIENQQLIGGRLTIDKIELVYLANDLSFGPPEPGRLPMYIQPVWRFAGNYDDGRQVVILIQALREEYLE